MVTYQVFWSDFAKKMLKEIHSYLNEKSNNKIADKIVNEIIKATKQLNNFPDSGSEEETLKRLNQKHRYIVKGNYKVIYRPIKEGLLITDVFDTRQNPIKINKTNR